MLNLTKDYIVLQGSDGRCVHLPPSGQVATVKIFQDIKSIKIDGIDISVIHRVLQSVQGFPAKDAPCIVDNVVLEVARKEEWWRRRVYAPDPLTTLRDEEGRLIVRGLIAI